MKLQHKCSHLRSLLLQMLGGKCSPAADLHVPELPLQLCPCSFTVLEPALCIPQPQQLLLQQAVLSLQKSQLPNGWSCTGLPISTISPERAPYSSSSWSYGILWLQQQLQDGVLFDDSTLQDMLENPVSKTLQAENGIQKYASSKVTSNSLSQKDGLLHTHTINLQTELKSYQKVVLCTLNCFSSSLWIV